MTLDSKLNPVCNCVNVPGLGDPSTTLVGLGQVSWLDH